MIYRSSRHRRKAQLLKNGIRQQDILNFSSSGCTNGLVSRVSFSSWRFPLLILGVMIARVTLSTQFLATKPIQTLNLIQGTNASIKFDHLEYLPGAAPHYTLRYRSEEPSFCCRFSVHISLTNEGLTEGQKSRFSVEGIPINNTFSVILNINNVSVEDGGSIELVYILLQYKTHVSVKTRVKRTAEINVINPPAVAECHFVRIIAYAHHIVRCQSPAENGRVTISCYQALSKIPLIAVYTDNEDMIRVIFLAQFDDQLQCCSHHISDNVTQETCDQSILRHTKHITTPRTTPVSHNSILPITKSPLHIEHDLTTEAFRPTSSADQNELSGWMPLYLQVIIVVCISLFNILK
ncbi:uncharacterized protein LOC135153953 [Lytechinus pictus]|uniref:uncharacterized protein LOC135153953 n=1 Tax=Lytechinus pictus TaxID=7653 RepID=UPI0030BA1022